MIENDLSFDENINDINFTFHDFPFKNDFDYENLSLFQNNLQNNNFLNKKKEENKDINIQKLLMKKKEKKAKKMFNIKKEKSNNNSILFKSENKKDIILKELIIKNELLKKRNRISAQKSRNKKKEELKLLYEQNEKLKNEVQEFHNKIDLLCSHCKCIFHEYNNENNSEYNSNNINISDTTNYMSSFSYISKQRIFSFSFIAIFTILLTFIFHENYNNNNNLRKLEIKMIEEKKIINNYTSIKNFPKIIIDDHILKKNYYMNFDDYLRLTNNNKDICHIDSYINIEKEINSSSKINSNVSKKLINTTINYNSVYFKMFMPLCDKDENKHSHSDYLFLEKIDNEIKNFEQDFYYEVKCKVMDFSKGLKS